MKGAPLDTTLVQFPTMGAFQVIKGDPDYAPYAEARQNRSVSRVRVINDTDLVGAIPYLPKAG